jgi:chemotaxis protein MotA
MSSLVLGFLGFSIVVGASMGSGGWSRYLQSHSLIIVLLGTIAILFFSSPNVVLGSLFSSLRQLFEKDQDISKMRPELMALAKNRSKSVGSKIDLVRYANELWEQGADSELFIVLLSQKKRELESKGLDAVQALKNLSKYPPALGMIGTVMGMVALFSALDENRDGIGGHLSMAMTATFLGLILTNGLISPLADRLQVRHVQEQRFLDSVYEILLLINRGEALSLINDEVSERAA